MRIRADLSTLLIVGAGAYLLWRLRGVRLGPPSDELMRHVGQRVQPPIWDGLLDDIREWSFGDGWTDWEYSGDPAADIQRRFEGGAYPTL